MLKNVFEKLRKDLSGELLLPESADYEISRKLFNGMIDKKPAAIVKCRTLEDVLLSVKFAEDYHLPISVKSGGHNVAGNALCENGLVVDFGLMRAIDVNPTKRTVKLQSGVTWGELDKECSKHELATTGGIISSTGVAGLTLGGGIGWLLGKYGLSCDNLMQAQVVLASGEVITASDEQNSDLMWGLRGAGSNFGIVTEFTMQLHSVKKIVAGSVYYPFDQAYQVLSFYRDFAASAPDELTLSLIISTSSSGEKQIQIDLAYLGDEKFSNKCWSHCLRPNR
jgi:FAD/FMN-containing dehydrogenase